MNHAVTDIERVEEALPEQSRIFRALQSVVAAVNQAVSVDEALRACLSEICEHAGWSVGHAFKLASKKVTNGSGPHLVSTQIWHSDADHDDLYELRRDTEEIAFRVGVGLPGRCLETHRIEWILESAAQSVAAPRADRLTRLGLTSSLVVPVTVGGEVVAALEFFWAGAEAPDLPTLELLEHVSLQLCWMWKRQRARRDVVAEREHAELKNRARRELLGALSQELCSPLEQIADLSDQLSRIAEQGNPIAVVDLHRIRSISRNVLGSLRQVLDLPRLETGNFDLEFTTFDVRQMIDELVHSVLPLAQETENTVGVRCAGGLGVMHSDQAKIRLCLYSLLHNACKMSRRNTITLGVTRQTRDGGEHLVFTVTDAAGGMPAQQVSEVFEAAVGVETAALYRYGGSGLGLAVARNCCRALRGDLTVVSQPDAGSTFIVWFPADAEAWYADPKQREEREKTQETEVQWTPRSEHPPR